MNASMTAKHVADKLAEGNGNENGEYNKAWFFLFKVSVYMFPIIMPMVVALMVWLVSEAFVNRDWRSRGSRITREEYLEGKSHMESRFQRLEDKYDNILNLLSRVDATTQSLKEEMRRSPKAGSANHD